MGQIRRVTDVELAKVDAKTADEMEQAIRQVSGGSKNKSLMQAPGGRSMQTQGPF